MAFDDKLLNEPATRADLAILNLQLRELNMTVRLLANFGTMQNFNEGVKQIYESLDRQQNELNKSFRELTGWISDA